MTRRRAAHSPVKSVGAVIVGTSCQCAQSVIQGITLLLHTFFLFFRVVFLPYHHSLLWSCCRLKRAVYRVLIGLFAPRYHMDCLASSLNTEPEHDWFCPECADVPTNRGIVVCVMPENIFFLFLKAHYFCACSLGFSHFTFIVTKTHVKKQLEPKKDE